MIDLNELRGFLDADNRLKQWPTKPAKRTVALQYLAEKFEDDRRYSEKEVNEILKSWHTYSDWALLRRELVTTGLLGRTDDGKEYWRVSQEIDSEIP